jgi:hypothetical protein
MSWSVVAHLCRWVKFGRALIRNTMAKRTPTRQSRESKAIRAKYPRHSVERALRIPKAILEQNAGKACTPQQAASFLGVGSKGPFAVEIGSAMKYGFLERPEEGKIQPTDLARKILRPKTQEDEVKGYREAVLKAPEVSDVYKHYRGENLPDETFFRNTLGSKTGSSKECVGKNGPV